MPLVGRVYTAWSGYRLQAFLLRGIVAATCLLPPTLLMGATLPALARRVEGRHGTASHGWDSSTAANIAGAVIGCLLAGFYLLREYDVRTATFVAAAINVDRCSACLRCQLREVRGQRPRLQCAPRRRGHEPRDRTVYVAIALSGLCALAAEAIWTRMLGLLFGASVYTLSIILAVFLTGLGIGSGIGSWLSRSSRAPRVALGWCQLLGAGAIAWTAYNSGASLPYWPINPSISSNIWFNFQLDLDRAFWALLPPTLLWGASFPLALAAAGRAIPDSGQAVRRRLRGQHARSHHRRARREPASDRLDRIAAHGAGAHRVVDDCRSDAFAARRGRWTSAGLSAVVVLLGALLIYSVPPISKLLIAYGRYAATWVGKGDIVYAGEGMNSSVAVSRVFRTARLTFHVAGKIQASNVPRDMRLQRMLGHLTTLTPGNPSLGPGHRLRRGNHGRRGVHRSKSGTR